MLSTIVDAAPRKYGYVPTTFPRDPAEVNQFAEHIVLGQILEPMVDTDKMGNVTPGLAESWKFEDKGLTIRFSIKKGRVFSNGKAIEAADIKYTIDRILAKKSQSSSFLSSISKVEAPAADQLVLRLKEQNVSILKALSRDQLGIVPVGWNYNRSSVEPIIGSGPYRLVKSDSKWLLQVNEKSPFAKETSVKEWELAFFSDGDLSVPMTSLPDYTSGTTLSTKRAMEKVAGYDKLKVINQISYAQTSAWWHPHGKYYNSDETKYRVMALVEEAFAKGCEKLKFERATGVIPKGVAGHTPEGIAPKISKSNSDTIIPLRIAFVGAAFDEFQKVVDFQSLAKSKGFELEIVKIPPPDLPKIDQYKPDVIFAGWAGGFNDPEGFIALLPTFLAEDFSTFIGSDLAKIYAQARKEENWTDRSSHFQKLNSELRQQFLMVPGWRIPFYVIGKSNLVSEEATYRYTPRLHTVREM